MAVKKEIEDALKNIIVAFDTFRQTAAKLGFTPPQHTTWDGLEEAIRAARELE